MDSSSLILTTVAAAIGLFTLWRNVRFHRDTKEENSSSLSPPSRSSAPSVPSSSLSRKQTHHVFASFHGEDVRRDFFSHIQMEFQRKGITMFNDNEITRGDSIGPELVQAIEGSKIATLLLSRNYASSKGCLDELVEIIKCREQLGQTVVTIFYKVDPSDVKKQTGDFGKVFRKTCSGQTNEDIGRWREALAKVATIAGYHSTNWDNEAAMIKEIATDISNKLNYSISSSDFDGLIGMRAHLEKMKPLLCLDSDEVRMIGIWGPAGIGKTTISRVVFNQLCNSFQLSVFMDDIKANYARTCSDDYSTKLQFQQHFMSQITNHEDMKITHLGVAHERMKDKRVLVVLDGVDKSVQLDAMVKETWWFGPGSRIIITTQDQKLLRAHGINHIYKAGFPPTDEALQIFCTNAFGQKSPKDGFKKLAWKVTKLAGDLPLGLRVLGSYFRGMSMLEWKKSIPRLETSLDVDIQSILRFSYDALNDEDKDLFLHIACFFNNRKIYRVEEYLENKFSEVRQRLNVLAEKSLVYISSSGVIEMHSLLEKLGREIVRKQCIDEPGKRSFLVNEGEICEVLAGEAAGSKSVTGIEFNCSTKELYMSEKAFEGMSNLKFLRVTVSRNTLQLTRCLNYIPRKLQFLRWDFFPMTCFPSTVSFEFLVGLFMGDSKLENLWEGIKPLPNLKRMCLNSSVNLKELPGFSTATNLQDLDLSGCLSLIKLPSTIGIATSLERLYLGGCSSLLEFPSFIENLINLQILDLSSFSNLVELPSSIGNATNLRELNLWNCSSLTKIPSCIGNATNLRKLNLAGCSSLVEFPSFIGNAINLQSLDLSSFSNLVKLPSSIGNATNLENLDLSYCTNMVEFPHSIGKLQKLQKLVLKGCSKLLVLPTNINLESLDILDLTNCSLLNFFPEISTNVNVLKLSGVAIEEVPLSIKSWPRLNELHMSYFGNLKGIHHAFDIITLLYLSDTEIQEVPPWFNRISRLKLLCVKRCRNLVSLPQISDSLSSIDAEGCDSLERLDCSFHNPNISLNFAQCFQLNQEARDLIIQTPTSEYAVVPGKEVPAYFTHRATRGDSLIIKLIERPLPLFMRFKVCMLLVKKCEDEDRLDSYFFVMCGEISRFLDQVLTEHLYTFEVEVEVTSSELVLEFKVSYSDNWEIGECGVLQLS